MKSLKNISLKNIKASFILSFFVLFSLGIFILLKAGTIDRYGRFYGVSFTSQVLTLVFIIFLIEFPFVALHGWKSSKQSNHFFSQAFRSIAFVVLYIGIIFVLYFASSFILDFLFPFGDSMMGTPSGHV